MKNKQIKDEKSPRPLLTRDSIGASGANGEPNDMKTVTILQHQRGYRFGLDALLLATDLPAWELPEHQAQADSIATIVELGAAQGPVSLCVARRHTGVRVIAVERQDALFELLRQNIAENSLLERVQPLHLDIRDIGASRGAASPIGAHSADLVLCNPPYFRAGERRPSANAERAAARHELHGGLSDFIDAARYILKQRGRLKIIIPPIRLADLLQSIEGSDLVMESMRFFHSRADTDAYLVESVLRRGGAPDLKIRPPLYIYGENGEYSDEVRRRVEGAASPISGQKPEDL